MFRFKSPPPLIIIICLILVGNLGYLPSVLGATVAPPKSTNAVNSLSKASTERSEQSSSSSSLPALKTQLLTIPAGTSFTISLKQPISSQINKVGDKIEGLVETPLITENKVILPKGSLINGKIVGIRSSGGAIRSGSLDIRFTSVIPFDGTAQLPLLAKVKTPNGSGVLEGEGFKSNAGQIATKTAIGAATGAAAGSIGSLLRHGNVGNGAIIGASIGASIGLIQSLFQTKPQPVELENNAPLTLVLEQAFTVGGNYAPTQLILPPYSPKSTTMSKSSTPQSQTQPTNPTPAPQEGTGYYGY
jgi:hypothetical protein